MVLPPLIYGVLIWLLGWSQTSDEVPIFFCALPKAIRGKALYIALFSDFILCCFVIAVYTMAYRAAKQLGANACMLAER